MTKKCSRCKIVKPFTDFYVRKNRKSGRQSRCKECIWESQVKNREKITEYYRQWRIKNKEKDKKQRRQRYIHNKEKRTEYARRWRIKNPEKMKEFWKRARIKGNTLKGKLNKAMRHGIWHSLKGAKAGCHWEDLVEFTVDQLKKHLEKLFKSEMTWENYGSYWEIDHKIPIAVFNFNKPKDIDFRLCWALKNLQPLEKIKNRSKRAKINKPFQPSLMF